MSYSLFKAFRENLMVRNASDISSAYTNITTRLNKDFWNSESGSMHCRQIGSYGRRTAIHGISDLDMAFEFPWTLYEKYRDYEGNGPSALLQEVRKSLKTRYPNTEIKGDGQVVVISFSCFVVEVLPVFVDNAVDGYLFPDSNDGGSWKICKPFKEMDAVDKRNSETNRNYKHVCKMVRAWKNNHGVSMSGMLIDTLIYNFFSQNTNYNDKSYGGYAELFVSIFTYLGGLNLQEYWAAPVSGQCVHSSGKFQTKAKKAAAKCQEAVNAEKESKKAKLWREVFGRQFPLAIVVVEVTKSLATASKARMHLSNEEFIEDSYPVDIRHELDIDCEVTVLNQSGSFLRRLLGPSFFLPKGRSLYFKIDHCDVPKPFQLFWKVRNVGPEAERRQCIRGNIEEDIGNQNRKETSDFGGDHFVEAYVIKDGVCVARDLISVPIAT